MSDENVDSGLREACGVFGCVAAGQWPTDLDVGNVICLGLVGLQHRYSELAGSVFFTYLQRKCGRFTNVLALSHKCFLQSVKTFKIDHNN